MKEFLDTFRLNLQGPVPSFLQYPPREIKVFRIGLSLKLDVNITKHVVKISAKIHHKFIKKRLKNQSKNKSDFGAENGGKMAPK